jgi:hypothetical protein
MSVAVVATLSACTTNDTTASPTEVSGQAETTSASAPSAHPPTDQTDSEPPPTPAATTVPLVPGNYVPTGEITTYVLGGGHPDLRTGGLALANVGDEHYDTQRITVVDPAGDVVQDVPLADLMEFGNDPVRVVHCLDESPTGRTVAVVEVVQGRGEESGFGTTPQEDLTTVAAMDALTGEPLWSRDFPVDAEVCRSFEGAAGGVNLDTGTSGPGQSPALVLTDPDVIVYHAGDGTVGIGPDGEIWRTPYPEGVDTPRPDMFGSTDAPAKLHHFVDEGVIVRWTNIGAETLDPSTGEVLAQVEVAAAADTPGFAPSNGPDGRFRILPGIVGLEIVPNLEIVYYSVPDLAPALEWVDPRADVGLVVEDDGTDVAVYLIELAENGQLTYTFEIRIHPENGEAETYTISGLNDMIDVGDGRHVLALGERSTALVDVVDLVEVWIVEESSPQVAVTNAGIVIGHTLVTDEVGSAGGLPADAQSQFVTNVTDDLLDAILLEDAQVGVPASSTVVSATCPPAQVQPGTIAHCTADTSDGGRWDVQVTIGPDGYVSHEKTTLAFGVADN